MPLPCKTMDYNFTEIEKHWQLYWDEQNTYRTDETSGKPKYYILDMFPYPSGAGLHVGHPLGYIASDIVARFKRHQGYEVLHPMGYDAFGLPAEQYAIDTGNHPAEFTEKNIARYRQQLEMIALSFDWSREVKTSDPAFYKWTQWIFIQIFHSWYNLTSNKAEDIKTLIDIFSRDGNGNVKAASSPSEIFSSEEWNNYSEEEKQKALLNYRLAYIGNSEVNWCEALGTVLANEEVKDGVSERGGYPVVKRNMKQWFMRITAYADRLIEDLNTIDWPEAIKEIQRNWIGKSIGAEVDFNLSTNPKSEIRNPKSITVFTTRPDTIFGATFMVLAPEHALVQEITTAEQRAEIDAYIEQAKRKSERERVAETKKITGAFTGAYAINPFTGNEIPVWIADYVLADYGKGAIMAVPGHDSRDWAFAKQFNLPIIEVVKGGNVEEASHDAKEGELVNSGFLNGLQVKKAIERAIEEIDTKGIGKKQINFRLRDANFSRQRYWGEPFPIIYKNDIPYTVDEKDLPVILPEVESYKPTGSGESPLAALTDWVNLPDGSRRETNTMPGWAGSSWYFLRYMSPNNEEQFLSPEREKYWQNVDFYIGGAEHATGHLLYSRFWHKFLYDRGFVSTHGPFKKMINQGMIQGMSAIIPSESTLKSSENVFEKNSSGNWEILGSELHNIGLQLITGEMIQLFFSADYYEDDQIFKTWKEDHLTLRNIPIEYVKNGELDFEALRNWRTDYKYACFVCQGGVYIPKNGVFETQNVTNTYEQVNGYNFIPTTNDSTKSRRFKLKSEIEKISKSKYNVITPDSMVERYGVDAFRMYEMFLGPIEQSKPWNTEGIDGVSRFLKKLWNLFFDRDTFIISEDAPNADELKTLHKTIKKVSEDIERFSLNTCISSFMICVNELGAMKCNKRAILEPLVILLSPFAPHISEELWSKMGHNDSVTKQAYPKHKDEYLVESTFEYPVSVNGKVRAKINLDLSLTKEQVEAEVVKMEEVLKWSNGAAPKKVIVVHGRIVNVVV